ncbi:MAG: molybdopterin cofactor-binding domain-containing protein [Vicinamibacterales bacterium]
MSVWYLSARAAGDPPCLGGGGAMSPRAMVPERTRREFLRATGQVGFVLAFALRADERSTAASRAAADALAPNAYLRIGADDSVTLWCTRSEMGQGVRTTLPMILADELEVDWTTVRVEQAAMIPAFAGIDLRTSGSASSAETWMVLRRAGATAREMLRAAAADLWHVLGTECRCSAGAVVHAASGRTATYGSLATRAASLPVPDRVDVKAPEALRLIGTAVPRIDAPRIVRGEATYGLDVRLPGLRFAAVARAPAWGDRARSWDASRVRSMSGVIDVVPVTTGIATGVAVVATSTHAALAGRDALVVEWTAGPNRAFDSEEFYRRLDGALGEPGLESRHQGDAPGALASAARRVERRYLSPFQAHACLEPMNCTADVRSDRCDIWVPTQAPEVAQRLAAEVLGLDRGAVRVFIPLLGGGFGRRLFCDYVPEAVEISRAVRAPVQVVWSRADDLVHGFFHPAEAHHLAAGIDRNGRVVAWTHKVATSDLSMYGPSTDTNPRRYAEDESPWGAFDNPYVIPHMRVDVVPVESPVPTGPWRAVEYPGSVFARESLVDEIALVVGRDPLDYRLELLRPFETVRVGHQTIDRARLRRVLEVAAERSGWGTPPAPVAGRRVGRGVACNVYHGGTHLAQVVDVSVGASIDDVRVDRVVVAVDCGQAINLSGIEGQVESGVMWGLAAARHTAVTFRAGRAVEGSFAEFAPPRMRDAPRIETHIVQSGTAPHGLGEQSVAPLAAALFNAVHAATGERVTRLGRRP